MQIKELVLYHRDGVRSHAVDFWLGRLNVITGDSETGKSALIEIVDYCLGHDRHGVYRSDELSTIGVYGVMLDIRGRQVFVARRAPAPGQKTSTDAAIIEGNPQSPTGEQLVLHTNIDSVVDRLAQLNGIEEAATTPPEGSTRPPINASLRHALAYVFQRQRLMADPEYLFSNQDHPFAAMAIRDTLPYFLGAVKGDSLQQRRELREKRSQLKRVESEHARLTGRTDDLRRREDSMLQQARDVGLGMDETAGAADPRAMLKEVLSRANELAGGVMAGEAGRIAELDDQRRHLLAGLRELRGERRTLVEQQRLATRYSEERDEQRARLLTLGLIPQNDGETSDDNACPLCGLAGGEAHPSSRQLRDELASVAQQAEGARETPPRLNEAILSLDERIAQVRGQLDETETETQAALARSAVAQQARSRREQQAFVRGRIEAFLEEHPPLDAARARELEADLGRLRSHVGQLESVLSPEAIRMRTERTLVPIGEQMTRMAKELDLSYTEHGVRLDPVALTVVAGDPNDPLWLSEDIGSGKNWVGFHLVTLLALHRHFVEKNRPVPRLLLLDQPTQAFYPSERRSAKDRTVEDLPDEDQKLVRRQFQLLQNEVAGLRGELQVIVTDHANINEEWFGAVVKHEWRDGQALVPSDWYE